MKCRCSRNPIGINTCFYYWVFSAIKKPDGFHQACTGSTAVGYRRFLNWPFFLRGGKRLRAFFFFLCHG